MGSVFSFIFEFISKNFHSGPRFYVAFFIGIILSLNSSLWIASIGRRPASVGRLF